MQLQTLRAPSIAVLHMQEDLQAWMLDKRARDQFVVRNGDFTEVMWNDPQRLGAETVSICFGTLTLSLRTPLCAPRTLAFTAGCRGRFTAG